MTTEEQNDDNERCPDCVKVGSELDAWMEAAAAGLAAETLAAGGSHEGQTAKQVVTAIALHTVINRLIEEVGNPFHVLAILNRCVMSHMNVQIIDLRGRPAEVQPTSEDAKDLNDAELANLPPEAFGNA